MRETVKVQKIDEVYSRIIADRGILRELNEYFSFQVEGYKFTPAYKQGKWDGILRIFKLTDQLLYNGLIAALGQFCKERDYDLELDYSEFAKSEISAKEAYDFIQSIIAEVKIDFDKEARDYQLQSFIKCVRNNRLLLLSPTSSGKSFMIYLLIKYYDLPTLLVVDSIGAVHQMADDFESYGYDPENIHKIHGGTEKKTDKPVVISTWQSLSKLDKEFFDRFGVIIGDEAHHFEAKSFSALMQKTTEAKYKFGFTGTIKDSKCSELQLNGLFGPTVQIVTTAELIEQGFISDLKIKCIIFQYDEEKKKLLKKATYPQEMEFITQHSGRNNFIKNLAISKAEDGENTILFFQYVEKHGKILYDLIRNSTNRPVFYIHGGIDGEIRNDIRSQIEEIEGCIIIASYGTFQTAISIKRIHNLIFGSPSKSKIRNLQSIGRGLRKHKSKKFVTLFDLADNLITGSHKNHTIKHFQERVKIYDSEKFNYKFTNINIEG